ncbi:glycosyltransferase [Mesorhizobium australafricanum]|uniref:Glycosyltransferase n=1 Tax=Mesorhizobium australafricanum TaxID=3072311 RepID=A0ABU4WPM4_9HYPH|nr:glycosyltransferase [Mesorhizobium sp. VK3E]MDX8437982.1 glycosyltransferase [Mesorhizobium sp. VK3E]
MKVREIIKDTVWSPGSAYLDGGKPAVSVLLPTCRQGANGLFRRAVESVLKQTLSDIELIIVDDASIDGTADQISDFMRGDGRVSCLRHARNIGLTAISMFEAFAKARADFIAFASDDAIYYPDALELLLKQSRRNPDRVCYGNVKMWTKAHGSLAMQSVQLGHSLAVQNLRGRNLVPNSAVLLPRSAIENTGLFDPHIIANRFYGWDLWRRIGERYLLHYVDVNVGEAVDSDDGLGKAHFITSDVSEEWMRAAERPLKPVDILDIDVFSSNPGISARATATIADMAAAHVAKRPWLNDIPSERVSAEEKKIVVLTSVYSASTSLYFDYLPKSVRGQVRVIVSTGSSHISELASASCLIVVRAIDAHLEWVNAADRLGIPVYYFVDDNFTELASVESYANTEDFSLSKLRLKLDGFAGVLLSTKELLDYYEENLIHKNLSHFPISYTKAPLKIASGEVDSGFHLTIASIGGKHRERGLRECVLPALHRLANDACKVHFVIAGVDPEGFQVPENRNLKMAFLPFEVDWNRAMLQLAEYSPDILVHAPSKTVNNKYKTLNVALCAYLLDAFLVVSNDAPFNIPSFDGAAARVDPPLQPKAWFDTLEKLVTARQSWDVYRKVNATYCRAHFSGEENLTVLNRILRSAPPVSPTLVEARLKEIYFSDTSMILGGTLDSESLKASLSELSALRSRIRLYRRFKPRLSREDMWKNISPVFDGIRRYVQENKIRTSGSYLELSDAIHEKKFVEYPIVLKCGVLKSIACAFSSEGVNEGLVGVELVNPQGEVAVHTTVALDSTSFQFPVTLDLKGTVVPEDAKWHLRLFARSNWPIYVLEFATYSHLGWRRTAFAPFAAIEYIEQAQWSGKGATARTGQTLSAPSMHLSRLGSSVRNFQSESSAEILVIIESEFATTHLIDQVMKACGAHGIRYRTRLLGKLQESDFDSSTIPLFVRCADPLVLTWTQALVDANHPYIYYIDDNFWRIPGNTPLAEYYRHPSTRKSLEFAIANALAVAVNSVELGKFISTFNKNIVLLPTFFDFSLIDGVHPPHTDEVRIGFAGSLPRIDDLDLVSQLVAPILEKFPQVVFEFAGVLPRGVAVGERVRFFPHVGDYKAYIRFQAERNWAIGLAPLIDNEANRSKTDNKYREYSACKIAGIYSDIPPYRGVVEQSVTGLLVDGNESSWRDALETLLEQPDRRLAMANAAYAHAKSRYDVLNVSREWASFFKSLDNAGAEKSKPLGLVGLGARKIWRKIERIKVYVTIMYKEGGIALVTQKVIKRLLA